MDAANVPLIAARSPPTPSLMTGVTGVTRAMAVVTFRRTARESSRHGGACTPDGDGRTIAGQYAKSLLGLPYDLSRAPASARGMRVGTNT